MPVLDLSIDCYSFHMCTPDLDMAGKWLMDLLCLYRPNDATALRLRIHPFLVPDPRGPEHPWIPDWEVTSGWARVWGPQAESAPDAMRKFADLVRARADELDPPAALEETP